MGDEARSAAGPDAESGGKAVVAPVSADGFTEADPRAPARRGPMTRAARLNTLRVAVS